MLVLLRTNVKGLTGPHPTSKPAWPDHFLIVETGCQSLPLPNRGQLQLAGNWGLSPKTLERWRVIGSGPKYIRQPSKIIYRLCDIETYENECLVSSTAELRIHTELSELPMAAARC